MRIVVVTLLSGLALLGAQACSGTDEARPRPADNGTSPPTGGGGGGGVPTNDAGAGDAGGDASVDAGACNDVPNEGAIVDELAVSGDPPPSEGGAILDGTYQLTAVDTYVGLSGVPGPTGVTYKATLVVQQGTIQSVIETTASATAVENRAVYTYSAGTTTLALQSLCPTTGQVTQDGYTVRASELLRTNLASKQVFTYTLR